MLGPTYQRRWAKRGAERSRGRPTSATVDSYRRFAGRARPVARARRRPILFIGRLSAPKGCSICSTRSPSCSRSTRRRASSSSASRRTKHGADVRAEAEKRGITPRVVFRGTLEGREKAAAYVTSKMIVVPSWTEAFPLVIPEAMAAGLP